MKKLFKKLTVYCITLSMILQFLPITTPITNQTVFASGVYSQVSAGGGHTVAIMSDGTVKAWGYNSSGQLGIGNTTNQSTPTTIPGLTGVKQIIAGFNYQTIALMNDGTVKAWGNNDGCQLGIPGTDVDEDFITDPISVPTTIPGLTGVKQVFLLEYNDIIAVMSDGTVKGCGGYGGLYSYGATVIAIPELTGLKQIASGSGHTVALMNDGTVKVLGDNICGQLGSVAFSDYCSNFTTIPGLTGVKQIAAGGNYTIALMNDGTVKVCGDNSLGQLGIGTVDGDPHYLTSILGLTGIKQISTRGCATYALMSDGRLKAWGENGYGQLGIGNTTNQNTPTLIPALTGAKQISAGNGHVVALMNDGTVKAWGNNEYGQLGIVNTVTTPTLIPGLTVIKQISTRSYHTVALMEDGKVKAWGINSLGQLGIGNTTNKTSPASVPGLTGVKQISAGNGHTVALMEDGTVKAWGLNGAGQLGIGNTTDKTSPTAVPGLTGIKQISTGLYHTVAIMSDGTVKAWGDNSLGQLGIGNTTNKTSPTSVPGLTGVKQISAGAGHTVTLMEDGTVKAWGYNSLGQLGIGNTTNKTSPTAVPGLTGVKQISVGAGYAVALMEDGTVKAWGSNYQGQLGIGTSDNDSHSTPTTIPGLTGVAQISAGAYHIVALMEDGTVKAWGSNGSGQLGLGNTTDKTSPTSVPGLTRVKQISVGESHTVALMNNGTVRSWGRNDSGQLGLGIVLSPTSIAKDNASLALNVTATDIADNGDGRDVKVQFTSPGNETGIINYRILVVPSAKTATFNLAAAQAVAATDRYTTELKTGVSKIHTVQLAQTIKDTDGNAIANGSSYNVFVMSVGVSSSLDALSAPSPLLNVGGKTTMSGAITVSDVASNGDGRDLSVTFKKVSDESKITGYRVFAVKAANAGSFTVSAATGNTNYKTVAKSGAATYTTTFDDTTKDSGGVDDITNGTAYKVYVLALGANGLSNVLSSPSGNITLSATVPATTAVAISKVEDVNNTGNASDIKVTFKGVKDETKISGYKVFVVVKDAGLTLTAASGAPVNARGHAVVKKGSGKTYAITIDAGITNSAGGAITSTGAYDIYVLATGTGNYSSSLSAKKTITLSAAVPRLVTGTSVQVSQRTHAGNASDIKGTFTAPEETNIASYQVYIVKAANAVTFAGTAIATITNNANHEDVVTTGKGKLHTVIFDAARLDSDGDAIVNGTGYKVFVLSVGKNNYVNSLSAGSRSIILN